MQNTTAPAPENYIHQVEKYAENHDGNSPSTREFDKAEETTVSSRTILRHYPSWDDYLKAANLDPPGPHHRKHKDEKELMELMVEKYLSLKDANGKYPSVTEYDKADGYGSQYLAKKFFNTWDNFTFIATRGQKRTRSTRQIKSDEDTKKDLIDQVCALEKELGKTPSSQDFVNSGGIIYMVYKFWKGGWKEFIKDAGLMSQYESRKRGIILQFLDLKERLDKNPSMKEFAKDANTCTLATVMAYFDDWSSLTSQALKYLEEINQKTTSISFDTSMAIS